MAIGSSIMVRGLPLEAPHDIESFSHWFDQLVEKTSEKDCDLLPPLCDEENLAFSNTTLPNFLYQGDHKGLELPQPTLSDPINSVPVHSRPKRVYKRRSGYQETAKKVEKVVQKKVEGVDLDKKPKEDGKTRIRWNIEMEARLIKCVEEYNQHGHNISWVKIAAEISILAKREITAKMVSGKYVRELDPELQRLTLAKKKEIADCIKSGQFIKDNSILYRQMSRQIKVADHIIRYYVVNNPDLKKLISRKNPEM